MSRKLTVEEFIKKAVDIHGSKYNYNKVKYINNSTKVEIYCHACKRYFKQTPHDHLSGKGCPYCVGKLKTTEDFIKQSQTIHGDKYNYDLVQYKNRTTKVKIYCKECGKYFEQLPSNHLKGHGCPYCANNKHYTNQEFIETANKIHKGKYSYHNINYLNAYTKIDIYCNKCQRFFKQRPADHLKGQGCPYCVKSHGESFIIDWLTTNNIPYVYQKRFIDCKDKKSLPFDFYLPDYNLCIEYQGEQHYIPDLFICLKKSLLQGIQQFKKQQRHDKIKRDYCNNQKITLIEIKFDDDIEKVLKSIKRSK